MLFFLAITAGAGCRDGITDSSKPAPPAPNLVQLQSDAGDYIGGGGSFSYTQANSIISVSAIGNRLVVKISGDQEWHGEFQSPGALGQLEPGSYTNLKRYPFQEQGAGALSWFGEGRGCNDLTGAFTIDSVKYEGAQLTAIDMRFEQRCSGGTTALRGTIHWAAGDTTTPQGPVVPIPSSLWRPAPGSTPVTQKYLHLVSDPGDYIGQARSYNYVGSGFTVSATGGRLVVSVTQGQRWNGVFQAMNVLTQLRPGYYGDLRRFPFHNPIRGGLDWSGEGRGCNTLTGWFAIDEITYSAGRLKSVDLRFEQHCEGGAPALRGQIRWSE
ncbi:MAG TPA: hypothetical protein VK420_20390 [Longimicrobium sp.]|jgi:hypothetical protein|nr:hypothetical protein [Longimicrobium sp.]